MEPLSTGDPRVDALAAYLRRLGEGGATRATFDRYAEVLRTATAFEVNAALHAVLEGADDVEAWKGPVSRFIRAASRGLEAVDPPRYPEGHLLARLDAECDAILAALDAIQAAAVRARRGEGTPEGVRVRLDDLALLEAHYVALQNELFPVFERVSPRHACVRLMWALQDDVLAVGRALARPGVDEASFWRDLGRFFLLASALVYRERRILFPVAFRALPEDDEAPPASPGVLSLPTGAVGHAELEAILRLLPVDLTFIGPDDRVRFYTDPPHRVFPRHPAIVGRRVQDCHPPKSVGRVEEILASFKAGTRDRAAFWLTVGGRFVHIEYAAVRDPSGRYLGTLEVSQDATGLRALQGEKRLL